MATATTVVITDNNITMFDPNNNVLPPQQQSQQQQQQQPQPPKMKTMEDLLVTELGNIEPLYNEFDGKMYAGTLPSNHDDRMGEMMFWLFEPTVQAIPNTIVIWLNGGPGCSSFNCGVMMEHSPITQPLRPAGYCCLSSKPDLGINEYTWTQSTTMLYPEQPIGTGFSYGTYPNNENDVAADLWHFMQNFYHVFPHLKSYELFIMGESYAGMYLPAVGRYFHFQNEQYQAGTLPPSSLSSPHGDGEEENDGWTYIPIGGVGIGNGWMNGLIQGPAVIDYSWWHGLIDEPTRNALHNIFHACLEQWKLIEGHVVDNEEVLFPPPFHSFNVQDDCGMMWGVLQAAGNPNAYDITTWDPNVDQITFTSEEFYNREDIRKALHAPMNITWHGCADGNGRRRRRRDRRRLQPQRKVWQQRLGAAMGGGGGGEKDSIFHHRHLYLENDRPIDVVPYVADLLNADIPVLVYNGDRDMTTNVVGSELLLNGMEWKGKDQWLDAERGVWMVHNNDDEKGSQGGWAKEYMALKFVVVYNSGHMVPYNRPVAALDLLNRFLRNESFIDVPSPTIRFGDTNVANEYFMSNPIENTASPYVQGNKSPSSSSMMVVIVAFLAGIIVTVIVNQVWSLRKMRQGRYTRIPNNTELGGRGKGAVGGGGYDSETSSPTNTMGSVSSQS